MKKFLIILLTAFISLSVGCGQSSAIKECPYCEKTIADSDKYCPNCGEHLPADEDIETATNTLNSVMEKSEPEKSAANVVAGTQLVGIYFGTCPEGASFNTDFPEYYEVRFFENGDTKFYSRYNMADGSNLEFINDILEYKYEPDLGIVKLWIIRIEDDRNINGDKVSGAEFFYMEADVSTENMQMYITKGQRLEAYGYDYSKGDIHEHVIGNRWIIYEELPGQSITYDAEHNVISIEDFGDYAHAIDSPPPAAEEPVKTE